MTTLRRELDADAEVPEDVVRHVHDARRIHGEDFEPLPYGQMPAPEPDLDDFAAQLHRIRDAIGGVGNSGVELADLVSDLRGVADALEKRVPDPATRLENLWRGHGNRRSNPVGGPENPISPPLRAHGYADGAVRAELTLGLAYQGPPGCVHGGVSSLILDHLMGLANAWHGVLGMTAHYELDYRSPTPLLEPLTFTSWVDSVDGRKIWTNATIHAGDRLCVEARGLFLEVRVPLPGQGSASTPGTDAES